MKTTRKLAVMLLIAFVCCLGAFAYDQNFDNSVVEGEWIVSTSLDNFNSIAGNTQTWYDFMKETLGGEPARFYNVNPSNFDAEDHSILTNLQGYIESWEYVEDNDVYAYVIARTIEADSGLVPDGWLVLCHYSKAKNSWTFYMYYFSVE